MAVVGVGIDLVSIPDFAEQVDQPGTVFAETFTPGERRDAADKSSSAARHLAARWAAKEAVIKAWSGSRFSKRPMLPEGIHRDIEVITDMWGRPKVRLTGAIAEHLKDVTIHLSLTHEADTAAAVAINNGSMQIDMDPGAKITLNVPFDVPPGTQVAALELHDSVFSGGARVRAG